jgi:hypothetical protein
VSGKRHSGALRTAEVAGPGYAKVHAKRQPDRHRSHPKGLVADLQAGLDEVVALDR